MKRLFLGMIPLLIAGCTASNYGYKSHLRNNESYKKNSTIQTSKKSNTHIKKQVVVQKIKNIYALNVNAQPKDSRIRILNIKPKFYNGIELKRGRYLIEVTKPGYTMYKKWILIDNDFTLNVTLIKKESNFKPNGELEWKKVNLASKFNKYSSALIGNKNIGYSGNTIFYIGTGRAEVSWNRADKFCKRLKFQGLRWRLPTKNEGKSYFKVKRHFYDLAADYTIPLQNKKILTRYGSLSHVKPNDKYNFICVADPRSIKDNYSVDKIAQDMYEGAKKAILSLKYKALKKPIKPKIHSFKPPKKGEFETSKEYKKRVDKAKIAYMKDKDTKVKKYKKELLKWEKENRIKRKKFDDYIKGFKDSKNGVMLQALQNALYIKYGTPQIKNIKYNADKEVFDMDVVSLRLKDLSIKDKNKLKNASKNKKDKVYITKNSTLIKYKVSRGWWYNRGIDLENLNNFEYVIAGNNIYSNLVRYINIHLRGGKDSIYIIIPNSNKDSYEVGDILMGPSKYKRGRETIYYDTNIISDTYISEKYYFKKHLKIKVPRKYAKLFKKAITNRKKFKPEVVFDVKNGKLTFKYVKNFRNLNQFIDFLLYDDAFNNPKKLKNYIATHKNSKYYEKAKKRYRVLEKFYKGYNPRLPFKVEGCTGYYPAGLIAKVLKKSLKDKKSIKDFKPNFWQNITWSGLCRKGLLSGRGYLRMTANKGNLYIDFSDGYMKNGFFTGDVEVEFHKHIRGAFWGGSTIKEKINLKSYKDFVNYQKGL